MLAETRPGRTLGDVLSAAEKAYRDVGHPDEPKLRDQGGLVLLPDGPPHALPGDRTKIVPGMVLAWRAMVQDARFADTYLVLPDGSLENLTAPVTWPVVAVKVGKSSINTAGLLRRPASAPEADGS
jgi:hypothetical protein